MGVWAIPENHSALPAAAAGFCTLRYTGSQPIKWLCCFFSYPTQDLDRIAEANELFDAVLTGSVNQDKKVTTNVGLPQDAPLKKEAKSSTVKSQKGGNSHRRLSLYIGNFAWVSYTPSVLMLITSLLHCPISFLLFCPHGLAEHCSHETEWRDKFP